VAPVIDSSVSASTWCPRAFNETRPCTHPDPARDAIAVVRMAPYPSRWSEARGTHRRCGQSWPELSDGGSNSGGQFPRQFAPSPRRILCGPSQSDPRRIASRILPRAFLCV